MQGHDLVGGLLQTISAVAQFFMSTAALFAGIAGELDAVDGKHVAPDQSLSIAGHQHLAEQGFDLGTQVGYELGNMGVAGLAVTTDGNELDVALAGLFDGPAGDQALAVGQQHDLEHDAGVIGTGSYFVVLKLGVQCSEVEFVVYQVVQCEGKSTLKKLTELVLSSKSYFMN